jgi:very-short-patch-repair endonuclease
MKPVMRELVERLLGPRGTMRLRRFARGQERPRWGNLRRLAPFSTRYGFDRGTPVDRYYLDRFLDRHRSLITGLVLEIQTDGHARRYGRDLERVDTVDISGEFRPTHQCDLASSGLVLPSERYDCFLLPNTLQHLRDIEGSLHHALRVIRPGGVILASAAGFVPLTGDAPDYWRMSALGWTEMLERVWKGCEVRVESHGNCLAAVAALLGLAVEELRSDELDVHDPRYPVLTTVRCRKPSAAGLP